MLVSHRGLSAPDDRHAMRLLIAEDDTALRQVLTELLEQSGYEVHGCSDGTAALSALLGGDYGLGIVDIGLPGRSGLEVVRELRARSQTLPILIVTARDALNDRIGGLDAGADDYMIKPFDLPELQARVRALLRRHRSREERELRIGPLQLRLGEPRIILGNTAMDLPAGEFALLETLAMRVGHVVSRERISTRLTRGGEPPSDTAIEICVHRLRRRLEPHGIRVRTLRGFGYLLEAAADG
jgi:two-component system OmpR family response regulator